MKQNKFRNWLISFCKGIGIGVAAVIPGVSGGTAAVLLRCYDSIVNAVSKLFKQFGKSFIILLPIALGCLFAIVPMWFLMKLATEHMLFATISLFAGLIIGGSPSIIDEMKKTDRIRPFQIVIAIISCIIAIAMGAISVLFLVSGGYDVQDLFNSHPWWLYLVMFPVGIVASLALIIPGISGSLFLLVIGFYTPILNIPTTIQNGTISIFTGLGLVGCLAAGVLTGFFLFSKLMSYLLNKHRTITFFGIFGFIIGSIVAIYFNQEAWKYYAEHGVAVWEFIVAAILLVVGAVLAFVLVLMVKKQETTQLEDKKNDIN
ncbi:MAG: DUF368 domain-containing protein [Bacilli bacterium]|jgi:putative membrane protein